jgi:hypothetical protein
MQYIGILFTIFSAIVSFFAINFRIIESRDLFTKLQLVHDSLKVKVNLRLMFSVWVPFLGMYLIPLLYKVFTMIFFFKTFSGLLFDACSAARFNYMNASVLTFVVACHIISAYYKEIIEQLGAVAFSNDMSKNSRLENLKMCHLILFESVERVKSLYGIYVLLGLVTSNMYFQMSVIKTILSRIDENNFSITHSKIFTILIFLSLDISRITLCFTSSNSVCKQVYRSINTKFP